MLRPSRRIIVIRSLIAAVALFCAAGSSRADTLPLVGVPSGYFPGQAFSFDVYAPGLVGLTDYTLQFNVTAGVAPDLPDLTVSAAPAASNYPFPDTSNFSSSLSAAPGVNGPIVTIQDASSGSGVDTVLGVNDRLATITISPGVNLSGPITITFTLNEFTTARDVGFDLPPPIVITPNEDPSGPTDPAAPVPAPPAVLLAGIGGLCFLARSRFRRAA
jgi:hypothetical protein